MTDLRVKLPQPCSEDWEKMAPLGCNRHCASCDTIIHDLSMLTVDEVEALLDSGEEICVRAAVRRDGEVRVAGTGGGRHRRIVAMIGATASLAVSACQTTSPSAVSPRYEVSGQIKYGGYSDRAQLLSETGKTYNTRIGGDRNFHFSNLRPGTYTLLLSVGCGEMKSFDSIVVRDDLNLGEIDLSEEEICIVVGRLERASEASNG